MAPNNNAYKREAYYKDDIGPLCKLFGKSRQSFNDRKYYSWAKEQEEIIVLKLVAQVRRELPRLGGHKIYKYIYQLLMTNNIKMGSLQQHNTMAIGEITAGLRNVNKFYLLCHLQSLRFYYL